MAEPTAAPDQPVLLPPDGPATLLVGARAAALAALVARLLVDDPGTIPADGLLRVDVDDARTAITRAAQGTDAAARERVRLLVCAPSASPDAVLAAALTAPTLAEWAHRLEDAAVLPGQSPSYGVRFQPIVDLRTGDTIGYEALIRATVAERRLDTEALLDRAARGGWSAELDRLGRSLALGGVGPWLGAGLLFLNVLAPGGSFDEDALGATLDRALALGLDADQVVFEATERNRYADLDVAVGQMERIRRRGARLAIDDVGAGWASLEAVTRFRPDVLKLSGRLVSRLPGPEASAAVGAVVKMAHQLGTWVVAEGVETRQQAAALRALDADWAQGHLFGRPVERDAHPPPD
jgi:EAL domain-containing protein (putative c-di-GMP-specific phosphodiesterase class I)